MLVITTMLMTSTVIGCRRSDCDRVHQTVSNPDYRVSVHKHGYNEGREDDDLCTPMTSAGARGEFQVHAIHSSCVSE